MTLLRPSQRQIKATSKRQMAKEHNLSQTSKPPIPRGKSFWWLFANIQWSSLSHAEGLYNLKELTKIIS